MLSPSLESLRWLAVASLAVVLAIWCAVLVLHAVLRRRQSTRDASANAIALEFASLLMGRTAPDSLLGRLDGSTPEVMWDALERFSDNISGEEWTAVSDAINGHPFVLAERSRIQRGSTSRRALAARRIGMVNAAAHRGLLHEAMVAGPLVVRLSSVLSLARAHDVGALRWLMRKPDALDPLGKHLGVAILKRFGPRHRSLLRRSIECDRADHALEVAAIEVLGIWKDTRSRVILEGLLTRGALDARVSSARALGRIGSRESLRVLQAAASDEAWQVRAQVARALGGLRSPEAVPTLALLVRDTAWWVRRNAAYALVNHGEPGRAALYRIAELGHDAFAREMAIEVMQADLWDRHSPGGLERVG